MHVPVQQLLTAPGCGLTRPFSSCPTSCRLCESARQRTLSGVRGPPDLRRVHGQEPLLQGLGCWARKGSNQVYPGS